MEHFPQPVILYDICKAIVAATAVKYGSDVYFYFDNAEKIEARLLEKDSINAIKYPAILFFCDIPENNGNDSGYYGTVTLPKIVIAQYNNDINSYAEQRMDKTFRPVLYPLYELFKKAVSESPAVAEAAPEYLQHRKWDRLYWGSRPAGKALNDYLDAIEIENLKLTLTQNC